MVHKFWYNYGYKKVVEMDVYPLINSTSTPRCLMDFSG